MRRLACALAAVFGLASSARAYVDATPTLGRLLLDAPHIAVLQVVKVNHEQRLILYRKLADLKGRLEPTEIKHRITDGSHPREPRTILDWAEPGKLALCLSSDRVSQVCIGRYWYECALQEPPWWGMTRGRPELCLAYYGSVASLRHHVSVMLAGQQTVIPAILHGVTGWRGYEAVAFKQSLRGKEVPIGRIKASLAMPQSVAEVMNDPRFLAGQDAGTPDEVSLFLQALHDPAGGVRAEAAENLGLLGRSARGAVPALRKALEDADPLVRIRTAGALLRMAVDPEAAQKVLLQELRAPAGAHRKAAAETLGDTGPEDKAVVTALLGLVQDPEAGVRWAALEALGRFGAEAKGAVQPLIAALKDAPTCHIAADVLGKLGSTARAAIPALVPLCQADDRNLRQSAAMAIIRIEAGGPKSSAIEAALPVFVEGLRSRDPGTRWQAVWCLKWLGRAAGSAVAAICPLLRDRDVGVRVDALDALGALGPAARDALALIREQLKDADGEVRIMAAGALWQIDKDARTAVAVFSAGLKESDPRTRTLAIQFLVGMGAQAQGAAPALVAVLADEDRSVRRAAALALGDLGEGARSSLPAITQALRSDDPQIRAHVADLLGRWAPDSRAAAPALAAALQDSDADVRIAAAGALVSLAPATPGLLPVLVKTLKEQDTTLRARAIHLLGQLGQPAQPAIPMLTPFLDDADPRLRQAAAETLKKLGPSSVAPVRGPEAIAPESSEMLLILVVASVAAALVVTFAAMVVVRARRRRTRASQG